MNKVKQSIGFFSMTIAWALTNILYDCYGVWRFGKAADVGPVIFWSGLFIIIAWLIFIVIPLTRLDVSNKLFNLKIFPFITTIYGALAYSVIVLGIFQDFHLLTMFLSLSLVTGLIFGISYSSLIHSERLISLLNQHPTSKIFIFVFPALLLFILLWLLPSIIPSLVFRFMPDGIRYDIIAKTVPKYKVGDDFQPLKKSLPGYFEGFENGRGSMLVTMGKFSFVLQVNCDKIIRLEYGTSSDRERTIYEKLATGPCP